MKQSTHTQIQEPHYWMRNGRSLLPCKTAFRKVSWLSPSDFELKSHFHRKVIPDYQSRGTNILLFTYVACFIVFVLISYSFQAFSVLLYILNLQF